MRKRKYFLVLWLVCICAISFSCSCDDPQTGSGQDDDSDSPGPAETDDDSDDDDDSAGDDDQLPFSIRSDYLRLDAPEAPPNPLTGDATPEAFNIIPIFRVRQDMGTEEPRGVRAILILVAGYTAGANQLRYLAERMVRAAGGDMEVWIPDRRCHLLEDLRGSNAAEEARDPWIAYRYYYENAEVDGKRFQGYWDGRAPELAMMSEWGLDLQLRDYRRIIELVPEEQRASNVFLGGSSRGVYFVQAYAAMEFSDGSLGAEHIAGLMLLDGGARYNSSYTRWQYLSDLAAIRSGTLSRTTTFSFLSPPIYTFLDVFAMVAAEGLGDPQDPALGPQGHFPDYGPFEFLLPFMTRGHQVVLTNEAVMGLVSDDEYGLMPNFHGHMGRLTGGEICHDFLGDFPCEDGASYSWLHWDQVTPRELMDLQRLTHNIFEGPSNNADPYYPSRLDVDFYVADRLETEGTWRDDYFHFATSRMDAPVFAMGTKLVSGTGAMESYRDQLPPARGQTRPRTEFGFDILYNEEWEHIDGLQVEPEFDNLVPALWNWVQTFAGDEVLIPLFGEPWTGNPELAWIMNDPS